ncbi:NPCBM/NEW2 domain-containing protein [Streptomyces sp. bgisy100]|uniref:NPCBM/NEW2 domain-containing protein n=1 Tax=Streptomyces sp. bgisy100 TaxID=3413783 RepID=UPI003D703496
MPRPSRSHQLLPAGPSRAAVDAGRHSALTVRLDGAYRRFSAQVGVDDEVNGKGKVTFG